jgi:hypothetical protein
MKKNLGIEAHRKTMRRVEDLKHQARYKRPPCMVHWFCFLDYCTVRRMLLGQGRLARFCY